MSLNLFNFQQTERAKAKEASDWPCLRDMGEGKWGDKLHCLVYMTVCVEHVYLFNFIWHFVINIPSLKWLFKFKVGGWGWERSRRILHQACMQVTLVQKLPVA